MKSCSRHDRDHSDATCRPTCPQQMSDASRTARSSWIGRNRKRSPGSGEQSSQPRSTRTMALRGSNGPGPVRSTGARQRPSTPPDDPVHRRRSHRATVDVQSSTGRPRSADKETSSASRPPTDQTITTAYTAHRSRTPLTHGWSLLRCTAEAEWLDTSTSAPIDRRLMHLRPTSINKFTHQDGQRAVHFHRVPRPADPRDR